jgi:hypothetical protein
MPSRLRFRFVPMVAVLLAIGADGRGLAAQGSDTLVAVDELKARLAMARTFGGRIIGPEAIARVAGSTRTLADLLRRVGGSAVDVVPASGFQSCFVVNRSSSMRGRIDCAQLVIDDVVVSGDAHVSPDEVDFIVILPVTQAMARFGQRARTGAVLVYTRGSGLPRG